ncbi:hypothetical protein LOAG_05505, partial [Loa loa]
LNTRKTRRLLHRLIFYTFHFFQRYRQYYCQIAHHIKHVYIHMLDGHMRTNTCWTHADRHTDGHTHTHTHIHTHTHTYTHTDTHTHTHTHIHTHTHAQHLM